MLCTLVLLPYRLWLHNRLVNASSPGTYIHTYIHNRGDTRLIDSNDAAGPVPVIKSTAGTALFKPHQHLQKEALLACHNKYSGDERHSTNTTADMAMTEVHRPLLDGYAGQRRSSLKSAAIHGPPPRTHRRTALLTRFTLTRFTSIVLSALALYAVIGLYRALGVSITDPSTWCLRLPHRNWPHQEHPIEYWEHIVTSYPKADRAKEWSRYYTSGPHLGGKNYTQAKWTKDRLEELGIDTNIESYDIYVNYPVGHRLALLEKHDDDYKVKYEAKLEEPVLEKDKTSGLWDRIPTFHGYSAKYYHTLSTSHFIPPS